MTDTGTLVAPAPREHDGTGFDRFAVVTFAPVQIREDLRKVRAGCAPNGRPMPDAHVTIKPVFSGIPDLGPVHDAIREAVTGTTPFAIRTIEPQVESGPRGASIRLPLEESPGLRLLHDRLVAALRPFGSHDSEQDRPGGFTPRLTVVQGLPVDGIEHAVRAVEGWRLNYYWTVRDVDLIGFTDGLWRSLKVFRFGRR